MLVKSQVKYIQSLSQKKLRDQEGVFVAEGPKIINELLGAPSVELIQLYAQKEWMMRSEKLAVSFDKNKIALIEESDLERISSLVTANEVLGVFKKPVFDWVLDPIGKVSLLLDGIQDPGNMGTIIRSADWFGVNQVICSKDCADLYNSKVVQSTMGSITRVQVLYTDIAIFLEKYKQLPTYAALLEGTPIQKISKIKEGIIIIGNESKGINPVFLSPSIYKITIPGGGNAESLNASVATGILLSYLT